MFKETFKYYKSKCPPPTFENVVDFDNINEEVKLELILSDIW